jgi:hypothetical protein
MGLERTRGSPIPPQRHGPLGTTLARLAARSPNRAAKVVRCSSRARTLGAVLWLTVAACDGPKVGAPPSVTLDTLANGAIHVRNSGAGTWSATPGARWRVVEDLRIGRPDGQGPDVFGRVRTVTVDELDRMWVVDGLANQVRMFNADGGFVRAIGRQGSGPGEFMRIGPAFPGPDGEIWVEDLGRSRWERFDTAGNWVGGLRSRSRVRGALRLWTYDGRFLVVDAHPTDPNGAMFVVHRLIAGDSLVPEGTFAFPELPRPELLTSATGVGVPVPFAPLPWMEVTPEGHLWVSHVVGRYVIRRQTLDGDTLQLIERTYDPIPIPDSARRRALAELHPDVTTSSAFREGQIPRVFPPFDAFHLSTDGTLWVRRNLRYGAAGFDVFSGDGRYLGQPEVPADLGSMRVQLITADHMYAVATDGLGVDYMVRLAIERPGGR